MNDFKIELSGKYKKCGIQKRYECTITLMLFSYQEDVMILGTIFLDSSIRKH